MKGLFAPRGGTFRYRGRWRQRGTEWHVEFTPSLNVAGHTKVEGELLPPPPQGPEEFDVALTFSPCPPAPPPAAWARAARIVLAIAFFALAVLALTPCTWWDACRPWDAESPPP